MRLGYACALSAMTTAAKRQPIPFGKYLLLDRINIGGMAEVWRGKTFGVGGFERLVAIKRILPNIAEDKEFISMFIDEAKITVQLNHANIAQIFELSHIGSSYFIAMEYIPGKDMRAIFDRSRKKGEPSPIPLTCYVVSKCCEGLDYAHRKQVNGQDLQIVHRDVSPQNVLVSYEGEVKVIDFGIAKAAGKASKTQAGILKGKFGYMSPEQIRGLPLDRRSDIFAIGVCLYEMLTGERLFIGESDFSVLEKVRKVDVLPPSTYNRKIPEALEKIVLKALARDVEDRYQYASELADDLQRFLITSDSIFSRKDLAQYMKATFAEEVEREKQRMIEYAEIKATDSMLAMAQGGYSGVVPMLPEVPQAVSPSAVTSMPYMGPLPTTGSHPVGSGQHQALELASQLTPSGAIPIPIPLVTPPPPGYRSQPAMPQLTAAPLAARLDDQPATLLVHDQQSAPRAKSALSSSGLPPPTVSSPTNPLVPALLEGDELSQEAPTDSNVLPPAASPVPPPRRSTGSSLRVPRTATPAPMPQSNARLFAVLGAVVALVVVGVGALIALRPPPEGLLLMELPADATGQVIINVNGTLLSKEQCGTDPKPGPNLCKVVAGPAQVMITVPGYQPLVESVPVKEGTSEYSKLTKRFQKNP